VNKGGVIEVLAAHAERMTRPDRWGSEALTRNHQVQGLLELAEQLQGILTPVKPDPDFRRRLHGDLILRAQCLRAEPTPSLFQQHRTGILIGAAAVGSVASVVGVVIAFVLRYRQGRATRIAAG
jgi:phage terminase large subunit-like protein